MQESFKRILTGTIIFVLTLVIAVIGYVLFWLDVIRLNLHGGNYHFWRGLR